MENTVDLKQFGDSYIKLQIKSREIMNVSGLEDCDLESLSVDVLFDKVSLNIIYRDNDIKIDYLIFDMDEMNNDISYFKEKYQSELECIEKEKNAAAKKILLETMNAQDAQDVLDYMRLKIKFQGIEFDEVLLTQESKDTQLPFSKYSRFSH